MSLKGIILTIINGGAAGNLTLAGILTSHHIKKVYLIKTITSGTTILGISVLQTTNIISSDITNEFTIVSDNLITNLGGTNTSNGILIITYS